jgi:hypothetical protein
VIFTGQRPFDCVGQSAWLHGERFTGCRVADDCLVAEAVEHRAGDSSVGWGQHAEEQAPRAPDANGAEATEASNRQAKLRPVVANHYKVS